MDRNISNTRRLALVVSTALAGLALPGCTTSAAPGADLSFASAQTALSNGQTDKAITFAEAAVLSEPRNPGYRALLGASYLKAGRFQSAAASFGDALDLGDENPRTVLSFALAKIALGEGRSAAALLDEYAQVIDPADLGLALALAGQPERGVHVLVNAVRASDTVSPKLRQNLAYTYALAGNWRAARVMAAEDVPAGEVDQRMTQWAAMSAPEAFQQRIASLLNVTPLSDPGQPQRLALANFPSQEIMVAEAAAQAAPVEMMAKAEPSASFAEAFEAVEPSVETVSAAPVPRYVSNPVVQQLAANAERPAPAPRVAAASPQRRMAAPAIASASAPIASEQSSATHLVQLGSYISKTEATRGWAMLKDKFPQLKDHTLVVTEAVVNGRTFWRVAADGFGPKSSQRLCSAVKSAGHGCFAYAATTPLAGAVDRGARMASRSQ